MSRLEILKEIDSSLMVALAGALPYKGRLEVRPWAVSDDSLETDPVPVGEVWEVTSIFAFTAAAAGVVSISVKIASEVASRGLKRISSATFLDWQGKILLEEDDMIEVSFTNSGACSLSVMGIKRYASKEIESFFHKLDPIIIPADVQKRPPKDPKM